MNLTVGPLPPAVYWRRRAIVLGVFLVAIFLIVYACSGPSPQNTASASGQITPAASHTASAVPSPSLSPSLPSVSPSASGPVSSGSPEPSTSPAASGICADSDIAVTPVIISTSATTTRLVHGGTFDIKLKVRNTSDHACKRDVGSVPEELTIMRGTTKIWSSGDCGQGKGKAHDVRSFGPHVEIYADLKWSSYNITTTSCTKASVPAVVGTYKLTGRVGTKQTTVKFTITN